MSNIIITTDSTCDLGEYAAQRDVKVIALNVILGVDTYEDAINITPLDIFAYVEKTGELPKTAALSSEIYADFFRPYVEAGNDVIHISISDKASSSYSNARIGAEEFGGKVRVIDSMNLSSGQGLVVLKACDLRDAGLSADEIAEKLHDVCHHVNTSFIPDRLDYLHKGGRCSALAMYGANMLKLHPMIDMQDGKLYSKKKYKGSMERCITQYINELAEAYPSYDKTRCFVTHSYADANLVELAKAKVAEKFNFDVVLETLAGAVITGHCGRNTLGVLFITKED